MVSQSSSQNNGSSSRDSEVPGDAAKGSSSGTSFVLTGDSITMDLLWQMVHTPDAQFSLSETAREGVQKSRSYIESRIAGGEIMYGVNTGFGAFSSVRISEQDIEDLQRNLIRSHSVGIGEPFSKMQSKAMMILRANTLAKGHIGVRPAVLDKICEFLNRDVIPVIPSQGSVGASGDLAPLSHLALALIGEGEVWGGDYKGIQPLVLKSKEGLSLINGCQVMTAVGLLALKQAYDLVKLADIAGATSVEGLRGSRKPFNALISAVRPHFGEGETARNILKVMGVASPIGDSHISGDHRVQDAYSLRCMPAVHGSVKNALRYVKGVLEVEANSSTDNPLVFADANEVLSCGNFHGMPVAHALDFACVALASLGSISHERISKFISTQMSELVPFLAPNGGLNSGHMIVQVASASLVSENKINCHPASADSMPTSAEKEDHVSMGTIAARKFVRVVENVKSILAMELLSATQALDLIKPLEPVQGVKRIYELIRADVPFANEDRIFYRDIEKIRKKIESRELVQEVERVCGPLEC